MGARLRDRLGVGIVGVGWCASQHIRAFQNNPHTRIVMLCSRDEARARRRLAGYGLDLPDARFTTRYDRLLQAADVDIVSIATPNHLHARQAVAAARAGKHILLEKPTALDRRELDAIDRAVRRARVRTIVSFELHYHPFVHLARWLRQAGWLGRIRYARFEYISRITDSYPGWSWYRTRSRGRSHLLAAGCHAVDALRWCSGLEPVEVSAYHTRFSAGYQWPTSIVINARLERKALAQVVSSTDFTMPYTFGVQLMGDRATLRDNQLSWHGGSLDLDRLRATCPIPEVSFRADRGAPGRARIECPMPDSGDVRRHPFQGEIDELVECIRSRRESHLNVFDARKTMEVCLAADRSAQTGGKPVRLR